MSRSEHLTLQEPWSVGGVMVSEMRAVRSTILAEVKVVCGTHENSPLVVDSNALPSIPLYFVLNNFLNSEPGVKLWVLYTV